jgi:hypothetical protein
VFYFDDSPLFARQSVVGTDETSKLFLRGLYALAMNHVRMDALYLNGGAGFVPNDTVAVFTQLAAALIRSKARYPEGHGTLRR